MLASNLSICFHRLSSCFRTRFIFSENRVSTSLHRLSKSRWI
jgi:hypothetical protein